MKKIILALPVIVALTGCGQDIKTIKNGVMKFDKTITVGQALDGWKSCQSSEWDSFETERGAKIVEFTCTHYMSSYIDKIKESLKDEKLDMQYLDTLTNIETFFFTINKDSGFQIDYVETAWHWDDGTKHEVSLAAVAELKSAYRNEMAWDASILNKRLAQSEYDILKKIKTSGTL